MKKLLLVFYLYSFSGFSSEYFIPIVADKWKLVPYGGRINANKFSIKNNLMTIEIDHSASPIIHQLENPRFFKSLHVKAKITGDLNLKNIIQGEKGNDDFQLRIGLVFEGDKTLNFFQQLSAAEWVNKLFKMAKNAKGIDHVHFYSTYTDENIKGKSRIHPLSEYFKETYVTKKSIQGEVEINSQIDSTKKILGLWISSDGDDTKSKFKVVIQSIRLK